MTCYGPISWEWYEAELKRLEDDIGIDLERVLYVLSIKARYCHLDDWEYLSFQKQRDYLMRTSSPGESFRFIKDGARELHPYFGSIRVLFYIFVFYFHVTEF